MLCAPAAGCCCRVGLRGILLVVVGDRCQLLQHQPQQLSYTTGPLAPTRPSHPILFGPSTTCLRSLTDLGTGNGRCRHTMAATSNIPDCADKQNRDDAAASSADVKHPMVEPEPTAKKQQSSHQSAASPIHRAYAQLGQWCQSKMPLAWSLLPALVATLMAAAIILSKPAARWMGPLSFLTYPFIHLFY